MDDTQGLVKMGTMAETGVPGFAYHHLLTFVHVFDAGTRIVLHFANYTQQCVLKCALALVYLRLRAYVISHG